MLQAVIDAGPERIGPCRFDVLTTYPDTDRIEPPRGGPGAEVHVVAASPVTMILNLPLALLAWLLGLVGGPKRLLCRTASLRALLDADVVVDVSGIAYSDGRGVPTLVYNTLITGIPLLLGKRVVKCSQALGPFEERANRTVAEAVLSRCAVVCPRGARTEQLVADLGIETRTTIVPAADLAFLMKVTDDERARAEALIARAVGEGPLVAMMPSVVVERQSEKVGIDYVGLVAQLIDEAISRSGARVLLVPHSSRPDDSPGRMNDRPICRAVHSRITEKGGCTLIDESLPPGVLRAVIERSDVTVTSRFHAMISSLATSTPVLVVGWSHKYLEVLAEFDLEEWVIDFSRATVGDLSERLDDLLSRAPEVRRSISTNLPAVEARSARNLDAIEIGLGPRPG